MQPKNLKIFIVVFLPLTLAISILTSSGQAFEIPNISASYTYPTDEWLTSTPEEQGMNSTYISMMYDFISDNSLDIDSVLIARNGVIVEEAYLEDSVVNEALTQPHSSRNFETCIYQAQGKLRNWYSTTKSV
ncbi:hypothetical protein LCGC14_0956170, partial [marine sediment metagenome]